MRFMRENEKKTNNVTVDMPAEVRSKLLAIGDSCGEAKAEVSKLEQQLGKMMEIKKTSSVDSGGDLSLIRSVAAQKTIVNLKKLLDGLDKASPDLDALQNDVQISLGTKVAPEPGIRLGVGTNNSDEIER